ncbi:hypothetical protein BMETH_2620_0 [methanotrophic bacterial endosymbiont of Bathymodiolus sp.]|nr:hypothetical protein BMETH_2620_0 [methanotrophic bacterial endosymbiont of Bathymodiolus sp.]
MNRLQKPLAYLLRYNFSYYIHHCQQQQQRLYQHHGLF